MRNTLLGALLRDLGLLLAASPRAQTGNLVLFRALSVAGSPPSPRPDPGPPAVARRAAVSLR